MFPTTTGGASFTVTLPNEPATVRFAMRRRALRSSPATS